MPEQHMISVGYKRRVFAGTRKDHACHLRRQYLIFAILHGLNQFFSKLPFNPLFYIDTLGADNCWCLAAKLKRALGDVFR
ncbi:MAG: hypothetical protein CSA34_05300 [Desulfobulbus propionicus]|nr:MAG: hypothetical protein CSA34_05300 [Desulfobulbus propionicus]